MDVLSLFPPGSSLQADGMLAARRPRSRVVFASKASRARPCSG